MKQEIKRIRAEETWNIRHQVMWPDKSLSYIQLENDEDGQHYGLYVNNQLTSVISLFLEEGVAQFRKFATRKIHQGNGYGSLLLNEIIHLLKGQDVIKIWCNARKDKSDYYKKFGLKTTNQTFEKGGIEYVIMELLLPDKTRNQKF